VSARHILPDARRKCKALQGYCSRLHPVGFFGIYRSGTFVGYGGATVILPKSNEANLWAATDVFSENGFANRICNMFANGFANHTRQTRIRYRSGVHT